MVQVGDDDKSALLGELNGGGSTDTLGSTYTVGRRAQVESTRSFSTNGIARGPYLKPGPSLKGPGGEATDR